MIKTVRRLASKVTQIGTKKSNNTSLLNRKLDYSQPQSIDASMVKHRISALAGKLDTPQSNHTLLQETIERLKNHVSQEFKHANFFQYGLKLEKEAVDYIYRELCHIIYHDHTSLFVGQPIKLISSTSKVIEKSLSNMAKEVQDMRQDFNFTTFQRHLEETLKEFKMKSMFSFEQEFTQALDTAELLFTQPGASRHFSAHPVYNG